jgi:hypothetical protein
MKAREILDHQTAFPKTQDSGSMTDHPFHSTGQAVGIEAKASVLWKVSPTISVGVVRSLHRNERFRSLSHVQRS